MIVEKKFKNVRCDACGALLDEENWWDGEDVISEMLDETGWLTLGDRHYCENCWQYDDNDDIVTDDGRRWDGKTRREEPRFNYLELSEDMTLTQIKQEIIKGRALYAHMCGTLYKNILYDDIHKAEAWLEHLALERRYTSEAACYEAFVRYGLFIRLYDLVEGRQFKFIQTYNN
jgi:hypothetical protein